MASLQHRRDVVWKSLGSYLAPASSISVMTLPAGARVSSGSSGTTATVNQGHDFQQNDKFIVWRSGTQLASSLRTVTSSPTGASTSLTISASITLVAGDILVNLGADTGTTAPNWDGAPLRAFPVKTYVDPGQITQNTNATVSSNSSGEYEYWTDCPYAWELFRASVGTPAVMTVLDVRPQSSGGTAYFGGTKYGVTITTDTPVGFTGSTAFGIFFNKPSTISGTQGVQWARDKALTWALGEDTTAGATSFWAIWSARAAFNDSATIVSSDIFSIAYAGADVAGDDGVKFFYGSGMSVPSDYEAAYYHTFFCDTKRTTGDKRCAWFKRSTNTPSLTSLDSGGVDISATGNSRDHLRLIQDQTTHKRASIAYGDLSGGTQKFWRLGSDIGALDTQNFGLFDYNLVRWAWHCNATGMGVLHNNPSYGLDVSGTFRMFVNGNAQTLSRIENTTDGTASRVALKLLSDTASAFLETYATSYATGGTTYAANTMLYTANASKLLLGTGGTRRVVIDGSNPYVGIGAHDAPLSGLDILGTSGYNQLRLRTAVTPTASNDANGNVGDIAWDTGFIYVKTAAGAWKRAALSTF